MKLAKVKAEDFITEHGRSDFIEALVVTCAVNHPSQAVRLGQ
jgi:hypothetical protein